MEFRILGPLEVLDDGLPLPLGGKRQRALLALLLIRANEVVPTDRLVEELWSGLPPPTAGKILQNNVSRLRKAIGDRLETRAPGYLLRIEGGELDRDRFERLVEEGRLDLAQGSPKAASECLGEALSLWRGPALADLTYEPFAQAEIGRLQEARLVAEEDELDAKLALGRHADVVAELEALTAENPLRERLWAQLMLAQYRSGRQADALATYSRARRILVEELGIDPGPDLRRLQDAVLAQDPSLDAPQAPTSTAPSGGRRQLMPRRTFAIGAGALVLLAAAVLIVVSLSTGGTRGPAMANSVAIIDPGANRVSGDVSVGARPAAISAGVGGIWVLNRDDGTVSRIDPSRAVVERTIAVGSGASDLAAGLGSVWVADQAGVVKRLSPAFDTTEGAIRAPRYSFQIDRTLNSSSPIALGAGSVWYGHSSTVTRIDPRTDSTTGSTGVGLSPSAIAVGSGAVWVADSVDDNVTRIGPGGVTTTIAVGHGPSAIAVGYGGVWVADDHDNSVVKIDPQTDAVATTIPVGRNPSGLAIGNGGVWVANSGGGTVSRIDPLANAVTRTIAVGGSPAGVTVADGQVWVSVQAKPTAPATAPQGGSLRINMPGDFDSIDPALASDAADFQLEDATCAKLLNYPDQQAPAGSVLRPEVASSLPVVSSDGRTYTFTIRPGFRFSPPSNQPVTAETFVHTLERDLSHGVHSQATTLMSDIVGAPAFERGKVSQLSGVRARGRQLTIRLTRPVPDFPARIASPLFCAVPLDTPMTAEQTQPIPSAGPYYIAAYDPGKALILRRNPNYRGPRVHRISEFDYTLNVGATRSIPEIESGGADYAVPSSFTNAVPPPLVPRLNAQYGPASAAARSGHQQYFETPSLGEIWIALNPNRPLFANADLRKAVAFAIDRPALARDSEYAFHPDDHYMPPFLSGYQDRHFYPLGGPDLAVARRLAAGHGGLAVLYSCNGCSEQLLGSELAKIGIDVVERDFPASEFLQKVKTPGEPVDLYLGGTDPLYADPSQFLNDVLVGPYIAALAPHDPATLAGLAASAKLAGQARARSYGRVDVELAKNKVPLVPLGYAINHDFFSRRVGCQVDQPIYGMDLAAMCLRP